MAAINPLTREIVFKVVFYGPGLGGKTTTLQHIHDASRPEHRGKMVSLATAVDRTLYFDFLPIRVPHVRGMSVRLQLFTVPGQVYYNATRKLVLTGSDGVVFVADSQAARADANLESLENLRDNLREQKRSLATLPHVFQLNKRDLEGAVPEEEMARELEVNSARVVPTVATSGEGIFETLEAITREILGHFDAALPSTPGAQPVSLAVAEGGLADALRSAEALPPSRVPEVARHAIAVSTPPAIEPEPEAEADAPVEAPPTVPSSVPPAASLSFAALWSEGEQETVRSVEHAIASGDLIDAVARLDTLATRALAGVAATLGADAPRDGALIPVLLGMDPRRHLAFRSLVRDTRAGLPPDARTVLAAYALVIELRLARARIGL